jgi:hypothetical protein
VERVTASLVDVHVELPNYLLHCRAVILYHIHPTLGIQHCLYPWHTLVKLLYDGPPLDNDPMLVIVTEVTALDLIPPKMGVVIYKLGILLVYGGAGLSLATSSLSTSSITTSGLDLGS